MSAKRRYAVCYVILFIFPILCANKSPTLNDVLIALEKMVSFYKSSHKDMNLDGIYGLRVLEGQILVLLMEYEKGRHQHLPLSIVARLHMLHQRARNVSDLSLPYLAKQDRDYYNKLRPLVEKPFMVAHEYRRVDLTLRWKQTEQQRREVTFDEEFSDRCMGELMGTEQTHGRVCSVSPQCLEIMFVRGLMEYQITHQLLYTMLAEQEGCDGVLNQWLKEHGWPGGLAQVHLEFCSNNLLEIQDQMAPIEGNIIPIYQDLLMEQLFVCPALGFMEFLHNDWLKQILTWQKPLGCFGRMPVSDFGKNYKNSHQLDYQYEGDSKEDDKNDQAVETNRNDEQKGIKSETYKAKVSAINNSPIAESAVIQQSNKLHLVEAEVNRSFTETRQVAPRERLSKSGSKEQTRRQGVTSQKANMVRSPLENGNHPRRYKTGTSLPVKNKQGVVSKGQFPHRSKKGKANKDNISYKRLAKSKRAGSPKSMHSRKDVNSKFRENLQILNKNFNTQQQKQTAHLAAQRKLLFERALNDNCLSHKTAVAAGALSQYLRFLINPGSPAYQSQVSIDGTNIILNPVNTDLEGQEPAEDQRIVMQRGDDSSLDQPHQGEIVRKMNQGRHGSIKKNTNTQREYKGKYERSASRRNEDIANHVVLRPHPDDVIHSEVMENQGDEDNHPQDYYDPDGDNDEPDNYEPEVHRSDLPRLSLKVNPRFREDFRIDTLDRRENLGDEEYEQYVDDEEEEEQRNQRHLVPKVKKLDLLNPKRPGQNNAPHRVVIDVPAGETAREANHDEDTYSYYDEDDETDNVKPRRDGSRVNLSAPRVRHTRRVVRPDRTSAAVMVEPGEKQLPHPGASPPGRIYMALFSVMLAILVLMYRFVKKRRIVIRYHRNGCR